MKKIMFFLLLGLALWGCQKGQKIVQSKVPDAVIRSFYERYPVATDVQWRQNDMDYIVDFKYDNDNKEATFRNDGTFLEATK